MKLKQVKSAFLASFVGSSRYIIIGVVFFVGSTALSYKLFRKTEFEIEVKLADVSFADELPHVVEGDGTVTAAEAWDLSVSKGGKLDKLLVKDGDVVKKGQPVAYIDSVAHEAQLKAAIAAYTALSKGHKPPKEENEDDEEESSVAPIKKKRAAILDARQRLQDAKQQLVDSILKAPEDGIIKLNSATVGSLIAAGASIAKVENISLLKATVTLALPLSTDLTAPIKITITTLTPPLDLDAQLRPARNIERDAVKVDRYDVLMPPTAALIAQIDKPVHLKMVLANFKNVALVDKSALVSQDGQSKLLVLNSFGFMRWVNVSKAPIVDGRVVLEGVDPKLFHVVKPDRLETINTAIAEGARPTVVGPRKL